MYSTALLESIHTLQSFSPIMDTTKSTANTIGNGQAQKHEEHNDTDIGFHKILQINSVIIIDYRQTGMHKNRHNSYTSQISFFVIKATEPSSIFLTNLTTRTSDMFSWRNGIQLKYTVMQTEMEYNSCNENQLSSRIFIPVVSNNILRFLKPHFSSFVSSCY